MQIRAYFRLVRIHNLILVAVSVILGGWLEGGAILNLKLMLAAIAAALVAAFGYAFNDYCDVEVDRLNKPARPLVQGRVNLKTARILSIILAVMGLIFSLSMNWLVASATLAAIFLLLGYNLRLKKSFLWGNLTVGLLSGGTFVYGGLAVGKVSLSLVPAVISFVFHLSREILKDLEDHQADRQVKADTLPLRLGSKKTVNLVTFIIGFLVILDFIPYFLGWFNHKYLLLAGLGMNYALLYILWSLWKDDSVKNLSRLNSLMKLSMFLGLAAVYLGKT